MRCTQCQYPLWNLNTRICPECGKSYQPSEYQFRPGGVRFCCPHCDQAYYGTSEQGHLVPQSFPCVQCHKDLTMDEMIVRPLPGMEEKTFAVIEPVPWLKRQQQDWVTCWWKTLWRGMISPSLLMRGLTSDAPAGQAWWFAFLSFAVVFFFGVFAPFAALAVYDVASGGRSDILPIAIILPIVGMASVGLWMFLWGLSTHAVLRITGGCAHGLGKTFQAQCYTLGPCIFMAVPCLGFYCAQYVSAIWWFVVATIALSEIQQVRAGRAVLATLVLPGLLILVVGGTYFGIIVSAINASSIQGFPSPGNPPIQQSALTDAWSLAAAMQDYTTQNQKYPDHAAQLLGSDYITPMSFAGTETDTFIDTIPLGQATLREYGVATVREQQYMIAEAVDQLPAGVVAHRFGDSVFTYHGIDPDAPHSELWIFIILEDPVANPFTALDPVYICRADFMVESIDRADLPAAIERQNELRDAYDLPPLPNDLKTVTHNQPWTGPE